MRILDITATPQWTALTNHYEKVKGLHLREFFAGDPDRGRRRSMQATALCNPTVVSRPTPNRSTSCGNSRGGGPRRRVLVLAAGLGLPLTVTEASGAGGEDVSSSRRDREQHERARVWLGEA
jgi:hypothetical protein